MHRNIDLNAFEFRSDFRGPRPPKPNTVTLGVGELAAMLEEARETGHAEGRRTGAATERLDAIATDLSTALAEFVALARHLETLDIDPVAAQSVRHYINAACARILDGQGDLFRDEAADT